MDGGEANQVRPARESPNRDYVGVRISHAAQKLAENAEEVVRSHLGT